MEKNQQYFTPEQLEEWKGKYGIIHKVTTVDGLVAILRDPCTELVVMKMAMKALDAGDPFLATSIIINNMWLAGDEQIKTSNKHIMGIEEQIKNITDPPTCEVKEYGTEGSCLEMICEGKVLRVRKADQNDLLRAEKLNQAGEPFDTSIHLLNILKLSADELEAVQSNARAYLGMIISTGKIKNKVEAIVEKL